MLSLGIGRLGICYFTKNLVGKRFGHEDPERELNQFRNMLGTTGLVTGRTAPGTNNKIRKNAYPGTL